MSPKDFAKIARNKATYCKNDACRTFTKRHKIKKRKYENLMQKWTISPNYLDEG